MISNNIEKSKVEVGIMTARKKTIEEMEANYEGYSRAVKFVMKEDIDGIEGTVAESSSEMMKARREPLQG